MEMTKKEISLMKHLSGYRRIFLVLLMTTMTVIIIIPASGQFTELRNNVQEKIYDTEDGVFRIHYENADKEYVEFVGHAFSKAREFQLSLGFRDIALSSTSDDFRDGKIAIYVKDLIYEDRASKAVIGQERLQHFLVSDQLDKWQIYLAAAHSYFEAVQASYNTLGYEASEENAWIKDGTAKFIVLYTAMNDPEYKEYDEKYKQYGYLSNVMVEGKKTYGYTSYQVPTITSDSPLQNGVSKLGALSVSYWYYLHNMYGMQVVEDVITSAGSFNDDSIRIVSGVLKNYNATFADTVTGWYKSLGFWNKERIGDFSVYEGLMLVNDEMFDEHKNELPLKIENQLSRYGASFINIKFNSNVPLANIRFLNSGETLHVYAYVYNAMIDKYYPETFTVERGYHDFTIWGANAEVNFIVVGSAESVNEGFTISGGF